MGWLVYGVLGWLALAGFFWCLLLAAGRADRRDASAPREPRGTGAAPAGSRALGISPIAAPGGLSTVRDEPQQRPIRRGTREPSERRSRPDTDGGCRPPVRAAHTAHPALRARGPRPCRAGVANRAGPSRDRCGSAASHGAVSRAGSRPLVACESAAWHVGQASSVASPVGQRVTLVGRRGARSVWRPGERKRNSELVRAGHAKATRARASSPRAGTRARHPRRRDRQPKQLAHDLGVSLGVVAYHVRVLASLNLIRLVEVNQRRGSLEHHYTAVTHPLANAPSATQTEACRRRPPRPRALADDTRRGCAADVGEPDARHDPGPTCAMRRVTSRAGPKRRATAFALHEAPCGQSPTPGPRIEQRPRRDAGRGTAAFAKTGRGSAALELAPVRSDL